LAKTATFTTRLYIVIYLQCNSAAAEVHQEMGKIKLINIDIDIDINL